MLDERVRQMETDLERITGVRSARMRVEGGEVSEVHVVADADRRPKWIVRDVITALFAQHGVRIPHQRVSVAAAKPAQVEVFNPVVPCKSIEVSSIHLASEGDIVRAVVELREGERNARGSAEALATHGNLTRVVASATLNAVRDLRSNRLALQLEEARRIRLGRLSLVIAHVILLLPDGERSLVGCCAAGQKRFEAVACAVIDAVLRAADVIPPQEEEVEYEVREEGRG
jgi:hypothetical protein